MPSTLDLALDPVVTLYPVKRFTADQYLEMIRAEILTEDDKVELIDGVITAMAPAGDEHNWNVARINRAFRSAWDTHFLFVQGTVQFGPKDVYDPDFFLVRLNDGEPVEGYPDPENIDLIVEVAKSSLRRDQTEKAAVYAGVGIPDYWILDINSRQLVVHRQPAAGGYQEVTAHGIEEEVCPLALPRLPIRVGDLLGL